MGYLGNFEGSGVISKIDSQQFSGNNSDTSFTMSQSVVDPNQIEVFVGNVRQEPDVAYTVNGTTLQFTGAPALGERIYVINNNAPVRINTPADDTVDASKLKSNAVTSAKILAGAVTAGKIGTGGVSANTQLAAGVVTGHAIASGNVLQHHISSSVSLGGSQFKGNNGTVGAAANLGDIFRVNSQTLSVNTQINTTENASASGPITVAASTTLTVNGNLTII